MMTTQRYTQRRMSFCSLILGVLMLLLLTACVSIDPNSDYVIVVPVKNVAEPSNPTPNSIWGRLETTDLNPDGYRVRIGDGRYHKLIEPLAKSKTLTTETAISTVSAFAEAEVIEKQLCESAKVPLKDRTLMGSQRPSEIWVYVECVKP
jgi:hypothetical protein